MIGSYSCGESGGHTESSSSSAAESLDISPAAFAVCREHCSMSLVPGCPCLHDVRECVRIPAWYGAQELDVFAVHMCAPECGARAVLHVCAAHVFVLMSHGARAV